MTTTNNGTSSTTPAIRTPEQISAEIASEKAAFHIKILRLRRELADALRGEARERRAGLRRGAVEGAASPDARPAGWVDTGIAVATGASAAPAPTPTTAARGSASKSSKRKR